MNHKSPLIFIAVTLGALICLSAPTDRIHYVNDKDTDLSLQSIIETAIDGDVIYLYPGTYTLTDTVDIPANCTITICAVTKRSAAITGTSPLFDVPATSVLNINDLTATATGAQSAILQNSGANLYFENCIVNFQYAEFDDSVYIKDCVWNCTAGGMDSMQFDLYVNALNTEIQGTGWSFGYDPEDTTEAILTDCWGIFTATAAAHCANAQGYSNVDMSGCHFERTDEGYTVGLSGYCDWKSVGCVFENIGDGAGQSTFYAHNTNTDDSTLFPDITLADCAFYNWGTAATARSLTILTDDTIRASQICGNKGMVMDSCEVADITGSGAPIIYWTDGNFFSSASFNFGGTKIKANLVGPGASAKNIFTSGRTNYMNLTQGANTQAVLTVVDGTNSRAWWDYTGKITLNGTTPKLYLKDGAAISTNVSASEADWLYREGSNPYYLEADMDTLKANQLVDKTP